MTGISGYLASFASRGLPREEAVCVCVCVCVCILFVLCVCVFCLFCVIVVYVCQNTRFTTCMCVRDTYTPLVLSLLQDSTPMVFIYGRGKSEPCRRLWHGMQCLRALENFSANSHQAHMSTHTAPHPGSNETPLLPRYFGLQRQQQLPG